MSGADEEVLAVAEAMMRALSLTLVSLQGLHGRLVEAGLDEWADEVARIIERSKIEHDR